MKKKTLALIATIALAISLTACGGVSKDKKETVSEKEPVVESSVSDEAESNVEVENTENTIEESQVESTEASTQESTETPVEETTEASYEVSAVTFPDGSTPEPIPYEIFDTIGRDVQHPQPYYTVTNTSDKAYSIWLYDAYSYLEVYADGNFEPGESITLPALYAENEDNNGLYWCTIDEKSNKFNIGDVNFIETQSQVKEHANRVQEKTTIAFDASKVYCDIELENIDFKSPASYNEFTNDYIIFYDEAGNAIASTKCYQELCGIVANGADAANFKYPMYLNMNTDERFTWASADVYYSYEVAAE